MYALSSFSFSVNCQRTTLCAVRQCQSSGVPNIIIMQNSDRHPSENDSSSPNSNLDNVQDDTNEIICYSLARAQEIVRERHVVDMSSSNEEIDPIEWTVRKLVPIPAKYYWEVLVAIIAPEDDENKGKRQENNTAFYNSKDDQMTRETAMQATMTTAPAPQHNQQYQSMSADMVPWNIRLWHESIYSLSIAGDFITRRIAQPMAGALGLTATSPFSYVLDNMTRQEWEASQQSAREQCRKNQQRRARLQQQQQQQQQQQGEQATQAQGPLEEACRKDTI
jgi:hypothetical protein